MNDGQQSLFQAAPAESVLDGLNPPQLEAAEHVDGPILVLAGAGSGKTRVLTRRVANLVQNHGVNPRNIMAITFTNKATDEMRQRLWKLLGKQAEDLWISTFHSAGLRILRRYGGAIGLRGDFTIFDDDDSLGLMKQLVRARELDEKRYPPRSFLSMIDRWKNAYIFPEDVPRDSKRYESQLGAEFYELYQRELLRLNAVDFGDLLCYSVRILQKHPEVLRHYEELLHYVLVDEFQDTNQVQYNFVRLITKRRKNLLVVGDDDQSIYAFRGASINHILDFERDYPGTKVVKLEQNYRSTARILAAANAVIAKNTQRREKKLWTDQGEGAPICTYVADDEMDEALFVSRELRAQVQSGRYRYKDVAIFYRTNAQSRALEEALVAAGVPYKIFGGLRFYDRKEIKDLMGYLRLVRNLSDDHAFLRVVNTPPRGVGGQTVQGIADYAKARQISLFEAARAMRDKSKGIGQFVAIIESLREIVATGSLEALVKATLERSEYIQRLKKLKDPTVESRIENLQELQTIARQMDGAGMATQDLLSELLDRATLTGGGDAPTTESAQFGSSDESRGMVSLMTLHLAKGLEYPVVFFTGLEEGLVPHQRSYDEPNGIEEERRLCYVGITRAQERLYISRATIRGMFQSGGTMSGYRTPSQFIRDIPPECLESMGGDFNRSANSFTLFDDEQGSVLGSARGAAAASRGSSGAYKGTNSLFLHGLVKAADTVKSVIQQGPRAPLEALTPGAAVTHASFLQGVVQEVVDDGSGDPTVVVKFDHYDKPKRLVYSKARLSLR